MHLMAQHTVRACLDAVALGSHYENVDFVAKADQLGAVLSPQKLVQQAQSNTETSGRGRCVS